jgi:hypothetical protein
MAFHDKKKIIRCFINGSCGDISNEMACERHFMVVEFLSPPPFLSLPLENIPT